MIPAPEMAPLVPSFTLPAQEATGLTPEAAAQEIIRRWNAHNLSEVAKMINLDADIFSYPLGVPTDRNALIASWEMYFTAFPDVQGDMVRVIDMGDGWVVGELVFSGTHQGEFLGIPPAGVHAEIRGAILWRYDANGLATNYYIYFDNLSLVSQITPPSAVGNWDLYE